MIETVIFFVTNVTFARRATSSLTHLMNLSLEEFHRNWMLKSNCFCNSTRQIIIIVVIVILSYIEKGKILGITFRKQIYSVNTNNLLFTHINVHDFTNE